MRYITHQLKNEESICNRFRQYSKARAEFEMAAHATYGKIEELGLDTAVKFAYLVSPGASAVLHRPG